MAPDYAKLDDASCSAIARDREATALYGWRPYMHDPALAHWLHRITRPTLVLWGEADGIVTPRLMASASPPRSPTRRFEPIAKAGALPADRAARTGRRRDRSLCPRRTGMSANDAGLAFQRDGLSPGLGSISAIPTG